ncbi:glycosyltransferase family 4 protein [Krasilnikovia sp. MM14-A1004]|uniref:glycosyltransferase family 4 protein n=1 Tax=Krasilnikovia sp. MM14-A1004 TaxID=3373541 RepID=UPI00399CE436
MTESTSVRVTFVTQWFPPEPGNVPIWIASALRRRGFALDVLTAVPNYPAGKTYPGYRTYRQVRESVDDFDVNRVPVYPSHGSSAVGRIVNLCTYAISSAALGRAQLAAADVALVYSSPATAALAAMRAKKRRGTPYVIHVLDMWPDSIFASGFLTQPVLRRAAEWLLHRFVNKAYARADAVAVTSPGMRELLRQRGVPAEKISVVFNWADEATMTLAPADHSLRVELGLQDSFVLMYAGNHGAAQRLDIAIQAMSRIRDLPKVHLVMVGDGAERDTLQKLVAELGLPTVHFVDPVEARRIPGLMAGADMQLVALADQPLFDITIPSKIQSIMACGQPILFSGSGDAATIVRESGAGLTCEPGDPAALAETIRTAYRIPQDDRNRMGDRGHRYYHEHLSEARNAQTLADLLVSAARNRQRTER